VLLYQAFATQAPQFAHVSMILSPDRSKLSKRHGATAVSSFIEEQGYLPEAFCNFLALLGWSPEDGQEVATLDHIAQHFDLKRLAHSGAIFDQDKLNWLNSQYIRQLPLPELLHRAKPFLHGYDLTRYTQAQLESMLAVVKEPIHTLAELPEAVAYFFNTPTVPKPLFDEVLNTPEAPQVLQAFLHQVVQQLADGPEAIAAQMKAFCNNQKPLKVKTVMWIVRAAITGRVHGAELGTTLWLLGHEVLTQRVQAALLLTAPHETPHS
jgi:glutamyl/glutaminyl-tRNA synthetase